jgi:hypothetical protein
VSIDAPPKVVFAPRRTKVTLIEHKQSVTSVRYATKQKGGR